MADARNGSDRKPDPLAQLQQFLTDWERRVDGLANRVMGTDEFSRSMNGLQNLQLGMQKAFLDAMATHLKNLNMPSRSDVTAIGETLLVLEKRMARMEAMLAQVVRIAPAAAGPLPAATAAAGTPSRIGPPRTRQPPSTRAVSDAAPAAQQSGQSPEGAPESSGQNPAQDAGKAGNRYGGSSA